MKFKFAAGLFAALLGLPVAGFAQVQTQCVTNAVAGGTVNALTVPLLPCALATNILILTLAGANSTTTPTLQMAGFPVQPILTSAGTAPGIGALPGAGAVVLLTSTGNSWLLVGGVSATFTGTLTVPNGGTGATTLTGVLKGNGASPITGVTPLTVPDGGTGVTTVTGMLKGAGAGAFVAGTAGTDYAVGTTASSWTTKQTFSGATTALALSVKNAAEPATISATVATGTINYDVTTQSVLYYTSNASGNWTVNFRGNGTNSLDSLMATGDVVTVVFQVTQGGTAFYNSAVQVDGGAVTPKYQGGTAWSAGNINSVDVYSYAIEKTGAATFTVLASQTQFK